MPMFGGTCYETNCQRTCICVTASTRFVAPLSETDAKNLIDSQENANTKKNTTWALTLSHFLWAF